MDSYFCPVLLAMITVSPILGADPNAGPSSDKTSGFLQSYLPNLEPYEPMYFLLGTDPSKTKFQLSIKYRLFNKDRSLARQWPWMAGLYFGYTQTSFWDLGAASEPFEDTSYKPELMFRSDDLDLHLPYLLGSNLQAGLLHESNGRDGDASRSTNIVYLRPKWAFYDEHTRVGLMLMPTVWLYLLYDKQHNPNLPDYRGYFNLGLKLGRPDGLVAGTDIRCSQRGLSCLLDLTYPLHRWLAGNLDLYLHIQCASVLAESLLNYTDRTKAVRIGFAVVR